MATTTTPMPDNWESKFDQRSNRYYFIDHRTKKTQWTDPRLRHPSIWTSQRNAVLERLRAAYPTAPEEKVREQLLNWAFDESMVSMGLQSLGFQKDAQPQARSPRQSERQAGAGRSGDRGGGSAQRRSPRGVTERSVDVPNERSVDVAPNAAQEVTDHFALMALAESFPSATEEVLREVLDGEGHDQLKALARLRAMGYEDKDQADRKARLELEAKRRKDTVKNRLQREYGGLVTEEQLVEVLQAVDWEEGKARDFLKAQKTESEARVRMAEEFPEMAAAVVAAALEVAEYRVSEARQILQAKQEEIADALTQDTEVKRPASPAKPSPRAAKAAKVPAKKTAATKPAGGESSKAAGPKKAAPGPAKAAAAPKASGKAFGRRAGPGVLTAKDPSTYSYSTVAVGPDAGLRLTGAQRTAPVGPSEAHLQVASFRKYAATATA